MTELPINQVVTGDCCEVIANWPKNCIDLTVTSPPYYNSSKKYQRGEGYHYTRDIGEPLYTIQDVSEMLYDKSSENSFYCLNLGFSYGETGVMRPFRIADRIQKYGWFAVDIIVWHKKNPVPIRNRLTNSFEFIFVFAKNPNPDYPYDGDYKHNFIESSVASPDDAVQSSAPFPIEVPKFCIEVFSEEGDLILDPFLGSGTTALACKRLNRNWIGIELNEDYCEYARERLEQETVEAFV